MSGYRLIAKTSAAVLAVLLSGVALACYSKADTAADRSARSVNAMDAMESVAGSWADSVISVLSPRERIAQLFVPRLDITDNRAGFQAVDRVIGKDRMGGFLLGKGTISSYAALINYGQKLASVPLMITLDGEWGLSMRVSGTPRFPYNIALGAVNDEDLMLEYGREMARECRLMGIQVNFAPDIDVNSNPDNPVIGYRSFGEDPDRVGRLGSAYSRGMWQCGVMPVGKHFPGHGDTSTDSHKTLPVVDHDRMCLDNVDLKPFVQAIRNGIPAIMVGHLNVPALDPEGTPASLSKAITTDLLQKELGFSGLVFTDALAMKGASRPGENNCVDALLAGADILLGSGKPSADLDAVEKAVESGRISQDEIDRRCRKVLVYKYKLGLYRKPYVDVETAARELNTPYVDSLITAMSRRAITVVKDGSGLLPLKSDGSSVVVISVGAPAENDFSKTCREAGKVTCYSVNGTSVVPASVLDAAKKADIVVIGIFKDAGWAKEVLKSFARMERTVGVFFMNPFKVSKFSVLSSLDAIVLGYDDLTQIREAAADALYGRICVSGTLPVNLPGLGNVGHGIKY